jgi:hypothetical protein
MTWLRRQQPQRHNHDSARSALAEKRKHAQENNACCVLTADDDLLLHWHAAVKQGYSRQSDFRPDFGGPYPSRSRGKRIMKTDGLG